MPEARPSAVARLLDRIETLARISDEPGRLTRLPLGPAQQKASGLIAEWMRSAGMDCRKDAAGNLIGTYPPGPPGNRPVLALGSHYDTVRDAGRYDGVLGILSAIEVVQDLHDRRQCLDFTLQVLAFEDEEGVSFGSSRLGSHAYAGLLTEEGLQTTGPEGVSVAEVLARAGSSGAAALADVGQAPDAYVELHIEQGPVLEAAGAAVGVVTSIAGQARLSVRLSGVAGHAGTVPMAMRRDAMAGAAACILAVEEIAVAHGVVGTVGHVLCRPGAGNVVPGEVVFSVDMRSGDPDRLAAGRAALDERFAQIAADRALELDVTVLSIVAPTPCDARLQAQLVAAVGEGAPRLDSGAGHDAIAMSRLAPVGMLFVACRGGISHDPAEHVDVADVEVALKALTRFVKNYTPLQG